MSRRVARRQGLPPPECLPFKPAKTAFQQRDRVQALKNQLRYPYALVDIILRRHLVANDWDVNAAAASFRREEEEALRSNVSPADEAQYQSRRARTVGGSRLLAAADLRTQIDKDRGEPVQLSHASLLGLLQCCRWDLKDALEQYESYKDDLSDIISQFDFLRSKNPTDMERDERLAEFITLTSTQRVFSAERYLIKKDWDFVRAVNGWSRLGGLPTIKAGTERTSDGEQASTTGTGGRRAVVVNRHPRNSNDEIQPLTRNAIGEKVSTGDWPSDAEVEDSDSESEDENLKPTYATSKRQGYAIDIDREPAHVGCPDATKLRIETIRHGRYKCAWLPGKNGRKKKAFSFRWDDDEEVVGADDEDENASADDENEGASADDENEGASADDENSNASGGYPPSKSDDTVEFDWNNTEHITCLNNWRRQYLFRVTNQASKPQTVPFDETEDEWLWYKQAELVEEKWEELVDSTGDEEAANAFLADRDNFPLVAKASNWRRWEDEFNEKFAGTWTDGDQTEPRPERSAGSLNTHSHRVAAIVRDFHLHPNEPHRKTATHVNMGENEEEQGGSEEEQDGAEE
jgi:hypothetical protein